MGLTVLHPPDPSPGAGDANSNITFDLVAIHGLNGDPNGTWTHKVGQTMWLRDLVPKALPNVRVMSYGYDASFLNFTAEQDIRNISRKLLSELADLRTEKARRIVLVCHSLGGIIAKKALILHVSDQLAQVQGAVYGIIFLATPHRGSSVANYGGILAKIAKTFSPLNPPQAILEALYKDSGILFELTEDFLIKASRLHLTSFFEMRMTKIGPWKKMIVKEPSAVLMMPNEVRIGQNADHREIARFSSLQDRNFRPLLRQLEQFRNDILDEIKRQETREENAESVNMQTRKSLTELPIPPCDTFRGRTAVLKEMEEYFGEQLHEPLKQKRFTICGLGGSGKTQVALKYADLNRHKYDCGIFFLTATSYDTLNANIWNYCDTLMEGDMFDIRQGFLQRLSRSDSTNWLLILDGADDLLSVCIEDYIPRTRWGHIIITTRDQNALGSVSMEGYSLGQLDMDDAVYVLLHKANILKPSLEEYNEAEAIVKVLGFLALAIDHAGSYIRSRGRALSNFLHLCKARQKEVLDTKPRLAAYDKTVFMTWHMNFKEVERESTDATNLLMLFCFLDPSKIPEMLLDRASSPQKRWDNSGEMYEEDPTEAGVCKELVALLKDEIRFDNAIHTLLSFSLVQLGSNVNGLRNFSIHPLVQYCAALHLSNQVQDQWRSQAILAICHAFPRSEHLDPLWRDVGIAYLPQVQRVYGELCHLTETSSSTAIIKKSMASMLLAASEFTADTLWKIEMIAKVKQLIQNDFDKYLQIRTVRRESILSRLSGAPETSKEVLEKFIKFNNFDENDMPTERGARWNAEVGELVLSYVRSLEHDSQLDLAKRELFKWTPLNPESPSPIEKIVAREKDFAVGRILKVQGHFEEASELMRSALHESDVDDTGVYSWKRNILSSIAELRTELGQSEAAQSLLTPILASMKLAGSQNRRKGRQVQLALAESFIRSGLNEEAEKILINVSAVTEAMTKPDMVVRRTRFRAFSGLARIAHDGGEWIQCLQHWDKAKDILTTFGDQSHCKSQMAVVLYSIAFALDKLGRGPESKAHAIKGRELLEQEERRWYWYAGLDSYWRDYIVESVNRLPLAG